MRLALASFVGLAAVSPAAAQTITLKPLAEARMRYEFVDQDGVAANADAATVRVRAGVSATSGKWSMLVEGQGNLALSDDYFDGLNYKAGYPLVADPQNAALYRAQIQYRTEAIVVTAGRQRIALDDERFVGGVGFRQNGQTFDAVRAEISPVAKLKIDAAYARSVRTIWGVDGTGARPQAIDGDDLFGNVAYATPLGTITTFGYLVDEDEAQVQGFRLSSQTYGLRLAGAHPAGKARLSYALSFARQSDFHRNPNRYSADYYLVDLGIELRRAKVGAGYEVLGADGGTALTSFQTPFATGFKFQGWADKFLTTPPDGVRDLYGSAGYSLKTLGPLSAVNVQAAYHRFDSDRVVRRYGDEIDLLASAKVRRTLVSLRYADYRAKAFGADTQKLWLQLDWAI
ncbi:alginate export family protein [Novosphingobium tardum]|uniref:Alginate export family protein n=1 Tax=Novosphingobium tardum TaxID=1538021 RepID=A0ABV8RT71_9SPHN